MSPPSGIPGDELSAHENADLFGGLLSQHAADISIVENAGTFLV